MCCGATCCGAAPPNQKMTCNGSQCLAQCAGATLTCADASHPCGNWDFESGFENWTIDSNHSAGWDGRFATTTLRAYLSNYSLLIGYGNLGGNGYVDVTVSPCSGQTIAVSSFTKLTAQIRAEPNAGQPQPDSVDVTVHWYYGPDSYVESQVNYPTVGAWQQIVGTIPNTPSPVTRINIEMHASYVDPWAGVFYLDRVQFEP